MQPDGITREDDLAGGSKKANWTLWQVGNFDAPPGALAPAPQRIGKQLARHSKRQRAPSLLPVVAVALLCDCLGSRRQCKKVSRSAINILKRDFVKGLVRYLKDA